MNHSHKFPFGFVDVRFDVSKGLIKEAKIYGDFFGLGEITDVEEKLVGVRYDRQAIIDALADVNIKQYIGDIATETFVNELFA